MREYRNVNLKSFVEEKKVKRGKLEEITGWSRATVFRKLKGESDISDQDIIKISREFGMESTIFDSSIEEFETFLVDTNQTILFKKNVNKYITEKKIRKSNVALRAKIDRTTLDRYLKNDTKIGIDEMKLIARALRKTVEYFMKDDFVVEDYFHQELAFFSGSPTEEQLETTKKLIEFIRYHDAVVSLASLSVEQIEKE